MKKFGFRTLALSLSTVLLLGALGGCGSSDSSSSSSSKSQEDSSESASADADTTASTGDSFIITLYPDVAPITCENFEKLVNEGFYDGLTFHRVVEDFMAQGGDPDGDGTGGSDETIKGEFSDNGVENTLSHQKGIVSMARSNDPDSASSQFFICYTDCSFLDGSYAAFGEVTEGMDVVESFLQVERSLNASGEEAVPNTPIVMEKVEMIEDDADGNPQVQVTMNDFLNEE